MKNKGDKNKSDKNKSDKNKSDGDKNKSDKNKSDKNKSDKNKSDKNKSDKNKGDKNKSDKNKGDKNKGVRKVNFDKKHTKFPRKYSKDYCNSTSCDEMGFSQKASCRYYKNCYIHENKVGSGGKSKPISESENIRCYIQLKLREWLSESYKANKNYCYELKLFLKTKKKREQRRKTGKNYAPKTPSPLKH